MCSIWSGPELNQRHQEEIREKDFSDLADTLYRHFNCTHTVNSRIYVLSLQRLVFLEDLGEYRGSTYVLSMFIHYPKYKHKIPNVSPGLMLVEAYIGRMFGLVYRGPIFVITVY